jgi:hypothetical protein
MKVRFLSVMFAAVLQVVPLARVAYSTVQAVAPESTVIFRLVIGAVASLGAFDAVSGASTLITSPNSATGTIAQAFSYRITVGPRIATIYKAAPLPDGLSIERSIISGTPTIPGVTAVKLTASDGGHSVSKWITIYILPPDGPWPPVLIDQPQDDSAAAGDTTTFHSSVWSGDAATFQWYYNGEPIPGAVENDLTFANDGAVRTGLYFVIASNVTGLATSAVARLFPGVPLVNSNAVWKFSDTGKNMGLKWRTSRFKDLTWNSGTTPFGFGWGDETTAINPGINPKRPNVTTYFRHSFFVADSNAYPGFALKLQADDAAAAYLNGKEILRQNLPEKGNISFRKVAFIERPPEDRQWRSFNFFQPMVLTGTNLFAIEVHQAKTNGGDMRFDFRFSGLLEGE